MLVDQFPEGGELWRMTLENSPVGMTLVAPDGRLLAVNRALCEMLGYSTEELRAKTFQEITHPDDLAADIELLQETLAGKRSSYRIVKRYFHAGGKIVWGDLSVSLLRDPDGRPIHFISQIIDVTAQREYELRIAAANRLIGHQRRMLEAVYDTVDVGLVLIDREGHYEGMNRRHHDFMALAFPDGHGGVAGQLGEVFQPDGTTLLAREEMPTYRATRGEEFDDQRIWVGADPITRRALSVSARTVHDPSGEFAGAALAYKDVTDFMRALEVKDEFVASVSHELRTPLTSILGHLEMLRDRTDLPSDASEQVLIVERNALRLGHLVSDLLHVAQVRYGGVQIARTRVDLANLVRDALEAVRPIAGASDIDLLLEAPDSLPAMVDEQRMRQVVDNLVSNALKYSDPGSTVRVRLAASDRRVVFEVADEGIGIEEAELDRLFTRFFRGRQAQQRMTPGTGLGLNIVKAIVEAHDGEVQVRSEVGVGSTFCVSFPLVAP